jgi:hypothetical protein
MSAVLVAAMETGAVLSWAVPLAVVAAVCLAWLRWLRRGGRWQ